MDVPWVVVRLAASIHQAPRSDRVPPWRRTVAASRGDLEENPAHGGKGEVDFGCDGGTAEPGRLLGGTHMPAGAAYKSRAGMREQMDLNPCSDEVVP